MSAERTVVAWSEAWARVESLAIGNPPHVVQSPLQALALALCDLRRHIEALSSDGE